MGALTRCCPRDTPRNEEGRARADSAARRAAVEQEAQAALASARRREVGRGERVSKQCQWIGEWGECETPASERTSPSGLIIGTYCIYHFRKRHKDIAPPKLTRAEMIATALEPGGSASRAVEAVRLRDGEGLTFSQIGQRLGVSTGRARQIVEGGRRIPSRVATYRRNDERTPRLPGVTTRTANTLYRSGITTLEQVKAMSDSDLLSLRNFGRAMLAEVRGVSA